MHINYNRVTREMWITDQAGNVRARRTAQSGEKMVDAAGRFLTEHGFVRNGDYLLVADGSPMRRASIVTGTHHVHRRGASVGGVQANAVSRVLNGHFPSSRFVVKQRGDQVLVLGPTDRNAVRLLQTKGYRVEPQTQYELLVTGKVDTHG